MSVCFTGKNVSPFQVFFGRESNAVPRFFLPGCTSDLMESEQSQSEIQSSESEENLSMCTVLTHA